MIELQRYFLEQSFDEQDESILTGDDYKHIVNVMRMTVDDKIIAVSDGEAFVSSIVNMTQVTVEIRKVEGPLPKNELPVHVTIVNGLAKGDKHDFIVQKGTELGVSTIIPFKAERSIVKWDDKKGSKKIERLQKIAKQAAEQCHRTFVPKVEDPLTLNQLTVISKEYDVLLFADEEDAKSSVPHRIADRVKNIANKQKVLIVFGPEGGLSRNEAEVLTTSGFLPIALGPRILRTETAPLYFLSALSYEFE